MFRGRGISALPDSVNNITTINADFADFFFFFCWSAVSGLNVALNLQFT